MPINKETIISVFDEKLTLMQWLKTINKALEDAVLTGVEITKKGNATLSFKFTFEDGTFLETNDLVLQQGESVNGAYIQNGHLYLTLTNGTNLDAGNVKPVSNFSIDASQHLIVNYADGTSQDLGAIFQGNVNITGNLSVSGSITFGSLNGNIPLERIKDANGNLRFVEGNGFYSSQAGRTITYCKWSLSGTHLMFVLAGTYDEGAIVQGGDLCSFRLPQYIYDKIYPVFATSRIEVKGLTLISDDWTSESTKPSIVLTKAGDRYISFANVTPNFAVSQARAFRLQFDLLIDNAGA